MNEVTEFLALGALIGMGGAALMDVWSLVLRRRFGIPTLDYALLGRWIGHFPRASIPARTHGGRSAGPR